MKGYVVKDMDGEIRLFTKIPKKNKVRGWWESTSINVSASLDEKSLPLDINPQWKDKEPIKVELKIEKI